MIWDSIEYFVKIVLRYVICGSQLQGVEGRNADEGTTITRNVGNCSLVFILFISIYFHTSHLGIHTMEMENHVQYASSSNL